MSRKTAQQLLAELEAEDDGLLTRPIGIWSLEKLAVLRLYLRAFAVACQSVGGGYYIDGLAGPGMCRVKSARTRPYRVWGSPLLALRTQPQLQRCISLDIDPKNVKALLGRVAAYGSRASVYEGDANLELARLVQQDVPPSAPSFCFLDPQGIELSWATISNIALTPGRRLKPELLILFPLRMALLRLMTTSSPISPTIGERLDSTFCSREWRSIYQARFRREISPPQAKDAYLDLYCNDVRALGYRWVHSKAITAPRAPGMQRQEMYHLVFATDHPTGKEIMKDVFQRPYVLDFPVSLQPPLFEA